MSDLEEAMQNPAKFYTEPAAVLADDRFSPQEKIEILKRWEFDARELEVAEEENMGGGKPDMLNEVLDALQQINSDDSSKDVSPTKHGGA